MGFPSCSVVKNLPAMQETQTGGAGLIPGLGRPPPRKRKWQSTTVFLPGESMGSQRVAHEWATKQQ